MKTLYKIKNELADYFIIANDPTEAEQKLLKVLNDADYGFSRKRKTISITPIAEEITDNFLTGKTLIL